jgi:hypothetical protein
MTGQKPIQGLVNITRIERRGFAWQGANGPIPGVNSADVARFWAKVRQAPNGCWEWTASRIGGRDRKLYGQFTYTAGTKQVHVYAHRFAWMLVHGPIPEGHYICHRCDNGLCVAESHLFLGTQFDNMQDASRKGRLNVPRRKNRALIAEIQQRWLAGGITQTELAEMFETSETQISRWLKAVKDRPYERRRSA